MALRYGVGNQRPSVVALFSSLGAIDAGHLEARLRAVEGEPTRAVLSQDPTRGHLLGSVQLGPHRVDIVGLMQAVPESLLERTTRTSHWSAEHVQALGEHRAHAILNHAAGPEPTVEQYLCLYKVAQALGPDALLGVLNEAAWTFNPGGLVLELLKPDVLQEVRQQLPPNIWTSFVFFEHDEQFWCVTKGHHIFGVPDLVYRAPKAQLTSDRASTLIQDLLMNIFLYCLEHKHEDRAALAPGHTLSMGGGRVLLVGEAPSGPAIIRGPGTTLGLELVAGQLEVAS